jgi:hypothetical protein
MNIYNTKVPRVFLKKLSNLTIIKTPQKLYYINFKGVLDDYCVTVTCLTGVVTLKPSFATASTVIK